MSNIGSVLFIGVLVSLGIYTPAPVTDLLQEVAVTLIAKDEVSPHAESPTSDTATQPVTAVE